ncbi:MAG: hypothetical protein K0Q57_696 [Gammaproteobacteria bacterium]|jgi:hypothetical protein|nr:hypothetical protein [Gammaproteobacteria bacterium]
METNIALRTTALAKFLNVCKAVAFIIKTTTPAQRPRLFTGVWFFVCGLLSIQLYAIDPSMSFSSAVGYSFTASMIFGLLGASFAAPILAMQKDELRLFRVAGTGVLCGLLFTLIILFMVPIYLLLSHALPSPNTQEAEQLLLMAGVIVPFAYTCLPAIAVGVITTVLLRLFDYWFKAQPEEMADK